MISVRLQSEEAARMRFIRSEVIRKRNWPKLTSVKLNRNVDPNKMLPDAFGIVGAFGRRTVGAFVQKNEMAS